jgi:hypothetical protein
MSDQELVWRAVNRCADELRAAGIGGSETWRSIFACLQDLQAADLGMGSDRHYDEVEEMRDDLDGILARWDDAVYDPAKQQ